jgi:hypothetical protein
MVPTYTAKPGRRYRYYVCRTARQKGWSACPTKSVPAGLLEDAVVEQLRVHVPEADWQTVEEGPFELVRALVKTATYDGTTGAVSLHLIEQRDQS